MQDKLITIFKILLLSTFISLTLKYGGKMVSISPSLINVMIAVFFPSVVMAGLLLWRWKKQVEVK